MRWGIQLYISTAPALFYLESMRALQFVPRRALKSTRTAGKLLRSNTACGKVFSSISSIPITLLFCTHVCHPRLFFDTFREKRLNKLLRAGINPHLNSTHKTYRKKVKKVFLLGKRISYHLKPRESERRRRRRKSHIACQADWGS